MRRARIAGISIVVLLICGALGAGSASALQVGRCVSSPGTGKYKDANCRHKAGSMTSEKAFEFVKNAVKKGFKTAGSVAVLEAAKQTAGNTQVACAHDEGSGEYLEKGSPPSTKQVRKVSMTFTECEFAPGQANHSTCQSPGQPSGAIVTSALTGKLGRIEPATGVIADGEELHAEARNAKLMSFECGEGATNIEVSGCVIGELNPAEEMSSTLVMNFMTKIVEGVKFQVPRMFVGSTHICELEMSVNGAVEKAPLLAGVTITNEEPLELK